MKWNVVWAPEAENELAALWLIPQFRTDVTAAAQALDERLELNPQEEGESREGKRRITFEPPLGITFLVNEATRSITVSHVWIYRI